MTTTPYAVYTQLPLYGLPATALGAVTVEQQTDACVSATDEMNSYFGGRWPLPLVAWDDSITAKCCEIAAYKLMSIRGFNPAAGADVNYLQRYNAAIAWCKGVRDKAIHPTVTTSAQPSPDYAQPKVYTSSVVTTGGAVASNRGW
jgi:phage gp36-like protein